MLKNHFTIPFLQFCWYFRGRIRILDYKKLTHYNSFFGFDKYREIESDFHFAMYSISCNKSMYKQQLQWQIWKPYVPIKEKDVIDEFISELGNIVHKVNKNIKSFFS
jgi:hypothetical protein